jgi:hypothetical protein
MMVTPAMTIAMTAAARATGPVIESTICSSGPSHGMPEPDA